MTQDNFNQAITIISRSNQPKVSFNVPVADSYSRTYAILIHESNATLIAQLLENGFSLSMTAKGLSVNKY